MKTVALAILLTLSGCGLVRVTGDGYTVTAVYVLKDPKLDRLTITAKGSRLADYDSVTRADAIQATGGMLGTILGGVAKMISGMPLP